MASTINIGSLPLWIGTWGKDYLDKLVSKCPHDLHDVLLYLCAVKLWSTSTRLHSKTPKLQFSKSLPYIVEIKENGTSHNRISCLFRTDRSVIWQWQLLTYIMVNSLYYVKPETHRANRWPSEAFGETWKSSGTNLFGVFSCVFEAVCFNATFLPNGSDKCQLGWLDKCSWLLVWVWAVCGGLKDEMHVHCSKVLQIRIIYCWISELLYFKSSLKKCLNSHKRCTAQFVLSNQQFKISDA